MVFVVVVIGQIDSFASTHSYINRASGSRDQGSTEAEAELPEKLKGCDPVLVERIENEIIDRGDPITFDDIAGLAFAKKCVIELVVWPIKNPQLFTGVYVCKAGGDCYLGDKERQTRVYELTHAPLVFLHTYHRPTIIASRSFTLRSSGYREDSNR